MTAHPITPVQPLNAVNALGHPSLLAAAPERKHGPAWLASADSAADSPFSRMLEQTRKAWRNDATAAGRLDTATAPPRSPAAALAAPSAPRKTEAAGPANASPGAKSRTTDSTTERTTASAAASAARSAQSAGASGAKAASESANASAPGTARDAAPEPQAPEQPRPQPQPQTDAAGAPRAQQTPGDDSSAAALNFARRKARSATALASSQRPATPDSQGPLRRAAAGAPGASSPSDADLETTLTASAAAEGLAGGLARRGTAASGDSPEAAASASVSSALAAAAVTTEWTMAPSAAAAAAAETDAAAAAAQAIDTRAAIASTVAATARRGPAEAPAALPARAASSPATQAPLIVPTPGSAGPDTAPLPWPKGGAAGLDSPAERPTGLAGSDGLQAAIDRALASPGAAARPLAAADIDPRRDTRYTPDAAADPAQSQGDELPAGLVPAAAAQARAVGLQPAQALTAAATGAATGAADGVAARARTEATDAVKPQPAGARQSGAEALAHQLFEQAGLVPASRDRGPGALEEPGAAGPSPALEPAGVAEAATKQGARGALLNTEFSLRPAGSATSGPSQAEAGDSQQATSPPGPGGAGDAAAGLGARHEVNGAQAQGADLKLLAAENVRLAAAQALAATLPAAAAASAGAVPALSSAPLDAARDLTRQAPRETTRDAVREARSQAGSLEATAARLGIGLPLEGARPEARPVFNAVLRSMRDAAEKTETLADLATGRARLDSARSADTETPTAFTLDPSLQRPDLRVETAAVASRPAAPPSEASLLARPGQADFAPELGAQLTLWVREGVHEARLQLNPAELGPVQVNISLDGSAAQVSLSAQNAETRQALEAALPTLASNLRDAGMTLSGGGVFDQSQGPRQDSTAREFGRQPQGSNPSRQPATNTVEGAEAARSNRLSPLLPRARGMVDLVA